MTISVITPKSKSELKAALTSRIDGYSYNLFCGDIRNGDRYARLRYYYLKSKITIEITYWKDGINHAVDYASHCSTPAGVASKIAKFLDLK